MACGTSASRQALGVINVIGGFSVPALSVGQLLAGAQVQAVTVESPMPDVISGHQANTLTVLTPMYARTLSHGGNHQSPSMAG